MTTKLETNEWKSILSSKELKKLRAKDKKRNQAEICSKKKKTES